jgi:NADH:ubiquinone oxidoreductase subunit C
MQKFVLNSSHNQLFVEIVNMPTSEIQTKLIQFNEFFSIESNYNVNVVNIDKKSLPSFEQFMKKMPLAFKIASDIVHIDQAALRPLQGVSSSTAGQLVEYLHHQTQKIDLLIGYIISQENEEKNRFQGLKFGGGGLIFSSEQPLVLGQMLELKIFLEDNSSAVYCMGEVIETISTDNSAIEKSISYQIKVVFHFIQEDDREILVRTSLHEQSKQLQALAKIRNNKN